MSRPDSEAFMWSYWRGKHGIPDALEGQYPEAARTDPQLSAALAQLRNAEIVIDTIMTRRADNDPADPNR